jgi:hypothetical protein
MMKRDLSTDLLKTVLAKNIDVKDTLDSALYGMNEPTLLWQVALLGPLFSGLKTKKIFTGITTSGILLVEVNGRNEDVGHRFYKYYEISAAEDRVVLKGKELKLTFQNGKEMKILFPRIVIGLANQDDEIESGIRVLHEKIKASKEYFRRQKQKMMQESRKFRSSSKKRPSSRRGKPGRNDNRRGLRSKKA